MQAQQKAINNTPLEKLSELLSSDMGQVDALILQNMQSKVPLIPKLAKHLISAGGKRIRPLLTLASTKIFNGDMDKSYHLAAAVEFIHTATLLHDDVVDESYQRRGQKAANLIYGNKASVLVGDFLFSKSFQMMVESESFEILKILSNASAIIAQGEVLQLSTTNDLGTKMPDYLEVIESKTAALFAASCEVGAVLSNQNAEITKAMRDYGTKLGTAFQIIDDALDYYADQKALGKELGDDFKEGKMTAPIIFALENASEDERKFWQRTLAGENQNKDDFDKAVEIITHHKALGKTIELAVNYANEAVKTLSIIPDSYIKELLCTLPSYTITRSF